MLPQDIQHCVSCDTPLAERGHQETYQGVRTEVLLPLCKGCLEFPKNMDIQSYIAAVFALEMHNNEKQLLLTALTENLRRYQNPGPVIIGLIFTELHSSGGKILIGRRAINPYRGEWALISGYMETKYGGWQGNLWNEGFEEVQASIRTDDASLVYPYTFDSNPSGGLLLNFAVVLPQAVHLGTFKANEETDRRKECAFDEHTKPTFGIPIHQAVFERFCREHFGWDW